MTEGVFIIIIINNTFEHSVLLLVIAASDLPLLTFLKFCFVVFGIMFRLLVINTSMSVSHEQQMTPLTSDKCH